MTIGDKIRIHRKRLGLTQTELGERLGVKTNAVSKWECGRVEDIPTSKIKALAALFGVQPSDLIDAAEATPAEPVIENPDIRMIARAGKKMSPDQAAAARKVIEALFPEAFKEDD